MNKWIAACLTVSAMNAPAGDFDAQNACNALGAPPECLHHMIWLEETRQTEQKRQQFYEDQQLQRFLDLPDLYYDPQRR